MALSDRDCAYSYCTLRGRWTGYGADSAAGERANEYPISGCNVKAWRVNCKRNQVATEAGRAVVRRGEVGARVTAEAPEAN